jgi:hypothetical protein
MVPRQYSRCIQRGCWPRGMELCRRQFSRLGGKASPENKNKALVQCRCAAARAQVKASNDKHSVGRESSRGHPGQATQIKIATLEHGRWEEALFMTASSTLTTNLSVTIDYPQDCATSSAVAQTPLSGCENGECVLDGSKIR